MACPYLWRAKTRSSCLQRHGKPSLLVVPPHLTNHCDSSGVERRARNRPATADIRPTRGAGRASGIWQRRVNSRRQPVEDYSALAACAPAPATPGQRNWRASAPVSRLYLTSPTVYTSYLAGCRHRPPLSATLRPARLEHRYPLLDIYYTSTGRIRHVMGTFASSIRGRPVRVYSLRSLLTTLHLPSSTMSSNSSTCTCSSRSYQLSPASVVLCVVDC